MPSLTAIERRKRAVAAGGRPRVTEYQLRRYFTERYNGLSQENAAKAAGIAVSTGQKYEKARGFNLKKMVVPPDPVPYEQLGPTAKKALADFNFFRVHYKEREAVPWAGMVGGQLLELYHSDDDEYVLFNVGPGYGKSTLLTDDFIEWATLYERAMGREITVQLGHRTDHMAKRYVRRIKHSFEHNREMMLDFGRLKPEIANVTWSQEELLVEPLEWDDLIEKDPTISCSSQESGFIGGRYKLVVWDDLVDKHNSRTVESRKALVEIWETEAETRLNTPALLVLSGARYGPEDLFHDRAQLVDVSELNDGRPRPYYKHIKFRAHYEDKCTGEHGPWSTTKEALAHAWPNGCLLDPKRGPWKKLVWHMKNESRFRLVWQEEDVDPEGSMADPKWFEGGTDQKGWIAPGCFDRERFFGHLPSRSDKNTPLLSVVTLDPSASNFWALGWWLVYPGDVYVLYRGLRKPMQAPDILYRNIDATYEGHLHQWWEEGSKKGIAFTYFISEKNGAQRWLTQYEFVRTWLAQHNVVLIPHETTLTKTDPDKGVPMLGPIIREGRLRLPHAGAQEKFYSNTFKSEACSWPEGNTSDLVMHFWFLTQNLPLLKVAHADQSESDESAYPPWAQGGPPAWVSKHLAGQTPMPAFAGQRVG